MAIDFGERKSFQEAGLGKKLRMRYPMASLLIQAGELLRLAERPVLIGYYEELTGIRDVDPPGYVRIFSDVPAEIAHEVGVVMNAGGEKMNEIIAYNYPWPEKAAMQVIKYTMKCRVEEITGNKIMIPGLELN